MKTPSLTRREQRKRDASNNTLLENVKLYSGKGSGFGYSAELITAQIREKKTYVEVEIKIPFTTKKALSETSQALKLHNLVSVAGRVISIFLKHLYFS